MSRPPIHLTAAEAAEVLRVTPWEVAKLCKANKIQAKKPGRAWLITPEALQAYLTRNDEAAA